MRGGYQGPHTRDDKEAPLDKRCIRETEKVRKTTLKRGHRCVRSFHRMSDEERKSAVRHERYRIRRSAIQREKTLHLLMFHTQLNALLHRTTRSKADFFLTASVAMNEPLPVLVPDLVFETTTDYFIQTKTEIWYKQL